MEYLGACDDQTVTGATLIMPDWEAIYIPAGRAKPEGRH